MSSEKTGYPEGAPPAYTGDVDPSAPPQGVAMSPPAYPASTTPAQYPMASPASNYGGRQYGGNYNTQYGQQSNVQVVQTQPGVVMVQRNIAAGEQYSGLFIGSIVVTLLCCWPIGIFAIQRARQAKTAAEMGRAVEAEDHASASKRLMIASVVGGIIAIGIIVAITVVRIQAINNCTYSGTYC